MKALIFDNELKLVDNYKKPEPPTGEALIKVRLAGICNTDLEITKGYMGFSGVIGHEFVGVVEDVNSKDKDLLGKRVVGEINCACGECDFCRKGLRTHCPNRSTLGIYNRDGCFAEYLTLPVVNLIEIPDSVSDEEAVFTEPLAAALEIIEQVHIKPSDKIAVLGDGKLGLLIAFALSTTQADLVLIGKHENKLKIASEQGVKTALLSKINNVKCYDIVVDATGSINGFEKAIELLKPRGVLVLKSTVASNKEINLAPIVIDEIMVVGSRCGALKPAMRLLEKKLFDFKPLITKTYNFDEGIEAFEHSRTKGAMKVLLKF